MSVAVKFVTSGKLVQIATKSSPSLEQAIKEYPNNLEYNIIFTSSESNNGAVHDNAVKSYELVQFVRSRGVKMITLQSTLRAGESVIRKDCTSDPSWFTIDSPNDIENCMKGIKE